MTPRCWLAACTPETTLSPAFPSSTSKRMIPLIIIKSIKI
jgi:hypothetical protein